MIKKIKDFFGILIGIVGAVISYFFIREVAKIGRVKVKKNWTAIDNKTIALIDDNGKIKDKIKLPKDPETKKQLRPQDIEAVGISEGGNVNVKVNHNITNRINSTRP